MQATGYWRVSEKYLPHAEDMTWNHLDRPRRPPVSIGMVGAQRMARIQESAPGVWLATLNGWLWESVPESVARQIGIQHTPSRTFPSRREAMAAIEQAWKQRRGVQAA